MPVAWHAYWRLSRPPILAWTALAPLVGYGFAHWDYALDIYNPVGLLLVTVAWVLLHAGTLWLNASLDAGEGTVLFGGQAPPLPPRLVPVAMASLALAVFLATLGAPGSGACALASALLSVLYSHPRVAWKGHPLAGPLVNAVGYGILTPMVGWAAVRVPGSARGLLTLSITVAWALGLYLAAQVFQEEEDRSRGHRTLVATHGARLTAKAARCFMGLGSLIFLALCVAGWYPRACALALPFLVLLDRHLGQGLDERWARQAVRLVILSGVMAILGAALQFGADCLPAGTWGLPGGWGGEVSGQGTAAGRPDGAQVLRARGRVPWAPLWVSPS